MALSRRHGKSLLQTKQTLCAIIPRMTLNERPENSLRVTPRMMRIAARHAGQDIRAILLDAYRRHNTLTGVAEELGVTRATVSGWFARLGLPTRATISAGQIIARALDDMGRNLSPDPQVAGGFPRAGSSDSTEDT